MLLTLPQFQRAAGLSPVMAQRWFEPFSKATAEFEINTPARLAAFIAQTGHESAGFSRLSENLYYSDAERVARIFRSDFDLNKNRIIEPREVEFARRYTRNPEKWPIMFTQIRGVTVMKHQAMAGAFADVA